MDQDKVILWAEAKRLNIPDYRKVSLDELRSLIAKAKGKGTTPAKGKATVTSANGAKGKAAATRVVRTAKTPAAPVKGKGKPAATSTAKSVPAKSTTRKPAATRTAASGTAKRPTTGGKGKATAVRQARATTAKPRTTARPKAKDSYRVAIDNKSVNWKLPSNVGQVGKRKVVLDSLRANKGDKAKVFTEVKRYATKWYPAKDKHDADRMVVWLIGRVALDYVKLTGQHESGVRVGYGESTRPNDVRRREQRAAAKAAAAKAARAAARKPATATKAPARGKAAPAARKPAQGRTAAPRGKATVAAKGKGRR